MKRVGRPPSVAEWNPAERIGRASLVLEVEDPQAHRGGLLSAFATPRSEVAVRAVKLDVTFLMDFDGFDPAFRFVNGMVVVDSLALLDGLKAESANSLVTVRGMVYLRHRLKAFLPCNSTGGNRGPDAINIWPSTFIELNFLCSGNGSSEGTWAAPQRLMPDDRAPQ